MMKFRRLSIFVIFLIITTHRLPAPIQEIPESVTPAPHPKHSHEVSPARSHTAESASIASKTNESRKSSGPATVYIYRPAGFHWLMYNNTEVMIDSTQTRTMADARYSIRKLSPGKHVFEVKGGVVTNQHVPIDLDLQSGQTYYLRVSIDAMGVPEGKILFVQVPNATGAEEIAKLKQGP